MAPSVEEAQPGSDFVVFNHFEDGILYDLEFFTVPGIPIPPQRIKELYQDYFWTPLAEHLKIQSTSPTDLEYKGILIGLNATIKRIRITSTDPTSADLPSNYIAYLFESTAAVVDKDGNPDAYKKRAMIYKINDLSFMVKPLGTK